MREYSTQTAFLGTSRPAWSSKKHSRNLLQSKYNALVTNTKQLPCPGLRKNVKLPVLQHLDASHGAKGGRNWDDPLSNRRSDKHLSKKYTYFHFSSPVRLEVKPPPTQTRRNLPQGRLQYLQLGFSADPTVQDLRVNGGTVPLTRTDECRRPKLEIHVYVPSGKKEDAELLDDACLEETGKLDILSLEDSIL